MRTLPDLIRIGHVNFRLLPLGPAEAAEEGADGLTAPDLEEISIAGNLAPDRAAEVLLHEILHGIYHVRGLKDGMSEERVVTDMAPLLLEVLRDNQRVLEFLVNPRLFLEP